MLPVGRHRRVRSLRLLVQQSDHRSGRFLVAGDRDESAVVRWHGRQWPQTRVCRARDRAEVAADQRFDLRSVEVADRDDSHEIGAIPIVVETPQRSRRIRLESFLVTDRNPLAVLGSGEQHREPLVLHAVLSALPQAPLFDDDRPLFLDLGGFEGEVVGPLGEDLESLVHDCGAVRRDREHVNRFVKAGERVDVRAVTHADRFQVAGYLISRESLRPAKRHVLEHVRESALIIVLEHGAGVDHQSQLGAFFWSVVLTDVVAHPVRQRPNGCGGVEWQRTARRTDGRRLRGRKGSQ